MKQLTLIIAIFLTACAPHYSEGDRIGVVTKLSYKGIIWKSWEGSALIALPTTTSAAIQPEEFLFNVDPSMVDKVKEAAKSGKRVRLIYHQWFLAPLSIGSSHVIIDVQSVD